MQLNTETFPMGPRICIRKRMSFASWRGPSFALYNNACGILCCVWFRMLLNKWHTNISSCSPAANKCFYIARVNNTQTPLVRSFRVPRSKHIRHARNCHVVVVRISLYFVSHNFTESGMTLCVCPSIENTHQIHLNCTVNIVQRNGYVLFERAHGNATTEGKVRMKADSVIKKMVRR